MTTESLLGSSFGLIRLGFVAPTGDGENLFWLL